jgi:hypothetical protein
MGVAESKWRERGWKTRAEMNGIGLANNRTTTDRTWHVEVPDENELAEADDETRLAETAGDRMADRRITGDINETLHDETETFKKKKRLETETFETETTSLRITIPKLEGNKQPRTDRRPEADIIKQGTTGQGIRLADGNRTRRRQANKRAGQNTEATSTQTDNSRQHPRGQRQDMDEGEPSHLY